MCACDICCCSEKQVGWMSGWAFFSVRTIIAVTLIHDSSAYVHVSRVKTASACGLGNISQQALRNAQSCCKQPIRSELAANYKMALSSSDEDKCAFIEMLVSSMDFRLLYGVHSQHKQSWLELRFSCPRSVRQLILFTNFLSNASEFMRSLKSRSLRAINCLSG